MEDNLELSMFRMEDVLNDEFSEWRMRSTYEHEH